MPTASSELDRIRSALSDRYDVLRELGRGGMATVYLARDPRHEREVAIKVLQSDVADSVVGKRFLAEIRSVAHLSHPHILPLHDSGEREGFLWYAMPRVRGETLRDRLEREGPLPLDEALDITRELAGALGHAHDQGIIHRDVKPSNVMLADGHALLADFGIARALDQEGGERLTRTGISMGTPAFMSPEQSGKGKVDGRADQYALACVLYEMLVGDPPYTGPTAQVIMARHALEEIPSVRVARPAVPVEVEDALTRALAKTPADRFPTMEAFGRALEPPTAGWTTEAPARRVARRSPYGRVAVVMGAALVVSLGAAVALIPDWGGDGSEAGGASGMDPRRVAVGFLENETGDPSLDQIGSMGADWLTEGLHRTGEVEVVPTLSAMQAARYVREQAEAGEVADPVRAFAEETGAGKVVSGRYYALGDSIQFNVEITDAIRNRVLARADFRSARSDPAGAIGDLRDRVMGALALNLDERVADQIRGRQPPSYAAYEAFDEGMEHYLRSEWAEAIEPLRRAHRLDSTFVVPLLYAAASHYNVDLWSPRRLAAADSLLAVADERRGLLSEYDQQWLDYFRARIRGNNEAALRAIRRAAEIAPESKASYNRAFAAQLTNRPAEAVEALEPLDPDRGPMRGWFPYWQMLTDNLHRLGRHEEELAAAQAARTRHPERVWSVRMVGEALAALGRTDEIVELLDRVGGLSVADELPGTTMVAIADELRFHGHEEAATRVLERAVEWFESQPPGESTADHRMGLASALQAIGRPGDALAIVDSLAATEPQLDLRGWQGILAAALGDEERARRMDAELANVRRAQSTGLESIQRARIAATLGEEGRAVELLRRAYGEGFRPLRHPDFALRGLRDDPEYRELHRPRG